MLGVVNVRLHFKHMADPSSKLHNPSSKPTKMPNIQTLKFWFYHVVIWLDFLNLEIIVKNILAITIALYASFELTRFLGVGWDF